MSEEKPNSKEPATETGNEYQAPAVEEVVTRDGLEREVAYAGLVGQSPVVN
jgi:hypothetical protein